MEGGTKLEITKEKDEGKDAKSQSPKATYKQIPDADVEDSIPRTKSVSSNKSGTATPPEVDGAHEKMLPEEDQNLGHVKFISSNNERQNGDAKVDIGEIKAAFVGMGKEELMKYANDPFWVRLRWFLFISFWLLWAGMLAGAIVIIIGSPKCAAPEPRTWWEQGPLSEADIDSAPEELSKIKNNGIQGIFLDWKLDSYESLNSSESLQPFLQAANLAKLKVIIKLNPGTSSKWFEQSQNGEEDYRNYYIWQEGKHAGDSGQSPPNNWIMKNGLSTWQFSAIRKQYYYAPDNKPLLNFRNEKVVEEFSKVLREFLDAGVSGVALSGGPKLLVDELMRNNSMANVPGAVHTEYDFYSHSKTDYVPDLGSLLQKWRKVVKDKLPGAPFMLMDELKTIEPFKVNESLVIDLPKHSHALHKHEEITAVQLEKDLNSAFKVLGANSWPLWTYSIDEEVLPADVVETVVSLLPGVTLVEKETAIQKELLESRTNPSIMFGTCERHLLANKTVFAYIRVASGNPGYLVALNPSVEEITVDFTKIPAISEDVTVQFLTKNYTNSALKPKVKAFASKIPISPKSAIVLTYVPNQTK